MGESVLRAYRERVKPAWKLAFFSVLVIGLIAHLYKFTNTLLNHDALYHVYATQNTVAIGRWFLMVACWPSTFFDLPWITGLFSLFWIGLTAAVIVDLFEVRNPVAVVLTGGLLVTFPCIVNTFFFQYAADGYMLAMFLAALAVRLATVGDASWKHTIAALLLICFSCGIYQAYVSFALLLSMCHFMWELLLDRHERRAYGRWIVRQLVVYGGGLLAYWLAWRLCMVLEHVSAADYQGIGELGALGPAAILLAVKQTATTVARFFLGGDLRTWGLSLYAAMNLVFLAGTAVVLIAAAVRTGVFRDGLRLLLMVLSLLVIPVFACMWSFASPSVVYHMLMLQSLSTLYIFSVLLFERYCRPRTSTAAALFFALLVLKFVLQANACYFEMDKCMERSRETATEMLTRIHELDDGSVKYIAFTGGGDESLVAAGAGEIGEILVHAHQLRRGLLYDNIYAPLYLRNVLGSRYIAVDAETLQRLEESGVTDDMNDWPLRDSVKVVDDLVIVRLPAPAGGA
ncbi:MAG: glucosyltransferase domain-containing protein [Oscillospiraceae bacterium]|nr:glucosyltransferase domain-containing protein [Oscillospiraceae bacterium]